MRLKAVRVQNFRCVEDSGLFAVDHATCLVGKNESGKTAVLQALASLNPHEATPFALNKERDYPRRHLTNYSKRHPKGEATAVLTVWELEQTEFDKIEAAFGPDALTGNQVTASRRYGAPGPVWSTLPINLEKAIEHVVSKFNFDAAEKAQIQHSQNAQELRAILNGFPKLTEKQASLLALIDSFPDRNVTGKVSSLLNESLPKFMYFSNYDRMSGEVHLERLRKNLQDGTLFNDPELSGERLFNEFLDYAGVSLDEILQSETHETSSARLQAASNTITDQILEYWSQNPYISVNITVDGGKSSDPPPFDAGTIGRARVYNSLHRVDVPFSERSAGFIWFFSFSVKFAQVKDDEVPIILLLDEPGLSLHGKAQMDLRRYFAQRLAPNHQLIYSTHSPFMVPADQLMSVRIVEEVIDASNPSRPASEGTKVSEELRSQDPDTIFPLQGALGYELTQSLFVGKNTLLVDGPGEILYLQALSGALARRGRLGLDPKWVICPTGGIGKIVPFVTLFRSRDLNCCVLTNFAMGDDQKVEELRAADVLKAGAVLTAAEFAHKDEAGIEDLIEPSLFVEILNRSCGLTGDNEATEDKLDQANQTTPRLLRKARAFFELLPRRDLVYNSYTPPLWLIQNPALLDGTSVAVGKSLDRAESLFRAINRRLS